MYRHETIQRFSISLIALLAVLSLGYLAVVNDTATIGYAFISERTKLEKLETAVERLNTDVASQQSWAALEPKITALGLVERGTVAYARTTTLRAFATTLPSAAR